MAVYIREAHPIDGWSLRSNERVGIKIAQPKTNEERTNVAAQYCAAAELSIPLVVDTIDDATSNAYSGFPDRLYIVDTEGKIAYKGGRGPFGYSPQEMEQVLLMCLLDDWMTEQAAAAEKKPSAEKQDQAKKPSEKKPAEKKPEAKKSEAKKPAAKESEKKSPDAPQPQEEKSDEKKPATTKPGEKKINSAELPA